MVQYNNGHVIWSKQFLKNHSNRCKINVFLSFVSVSVCFQYLSVFSNCLFSVSVCFQYLSAFSIEKEVIFNCNCHFSLHQHVEVILFIDGVITWFRVARLTRTVEVVGLIPIKGLRCFLEQETLPLLLSTGWFKERILSWIHNRTKINWGPYGRLT